MFDKLVIYIIIYLFRFRRDNEDLLECNVSNSPTARLEKTKQDKTKQNKQAARIKGTDWKFPKL